MPTYSDPDDRERQSTGEATERVTVRVPKADLDRLEQLVDDGIYPNRSEALRAGVRSVTNRRMATDGGDQERDSE